MSRQNKKEESFFFKVVDAYRSPKAFTHIIGPIITLYVIKTQILDFKNLRWDQAFIGGLLVLGSY